jgi:hypothetical protein
MSVAMSGQRPIAIVKDYDHLRAAARARMAQLQITFETLDAVSGVQSGYSAKILGPKPSRNFGPMSLSTIFSALGMKLVAVEDPEALAQIRHRLVKRAPRKGGRKSTWLASASPQP